MAKAEVKKNVTEVVLTLSEEEALYLSSLTGDVKDNMGVGKLSRINENIWRALDGALGFSEFRAG